MIKNHGFYVVQLQPILFCISFMENIVRLSENPKRMTNEKKSNAFNHSLKIFNLEEFRKERSIYNKALRKTVMGCSASR